jgi:hypothetical protein
MTDAQDGFDPSEYAQLPDPGGFVPRRGSPCPDCGPDASMTWEIVRYRKTVKAEGGRRRKHTVKGGRHRGRKH